MKSFLKVTAAAALLALAFMPGRSWAITSATATLPVSASVTSGCLLGTLGINFGAVSPLVIEEDTLTGYTASGAIEIACGTNGPTSGSGIAVSLDNGANAAIAPILGIGTSATATRAMTNSTSFLAYDLFEPSITTSGLGGTSPSASTTQFGTLIIPAADYTLLLNSGPLGTGGPLIFLPVFGSIPGDQVQPLTPGIYTDTVNVSLLF